MPPVILCEHCPNPALYESPIQPEQSNEIFKLSVPVGAMSINPVTTPDGYVVNNRYMFFSLLFDWFTENFGNTLPLNIYCGVHIAKSGTFRPGKIIASDGASIDYVLNPYWTFDTSTTTSWSIILSEMGYAAFKLQWSQLIKEHFD